MGKQNASPAGETDSKTWTKLVHPISTKQSRNGEQVSFEIFLCFSPRPALGEPFSKISQDAEHHRTPERHRASNRRSAEDGDGFPLAGCPDEGGSRGGVFSKGPDSRFTLSPFRFIDEQVRRSAGGFCLR